MVCQYSFFFAKIRDIRLAKTKTHDIVFLLFTFTTSNFRSVQADKRRQIYSLKTVWDLKIVISSSDGTHKKTPNFMEFQLACQGTLSWACSCFCVEFGYWRTSYVRETGGRLFLCLFLWIVLEKSRQFDVLRAKHDTADFRTAFLKIISCFSVSKAFWSQHQQHSVNFSVK